MLPGVFLQTKTGNNVLYTDDWFEDLKSQVEASEQKNRELVEELQQKLKAVNSGGSERDSTPNDDQTPENTLERIKQLTAQLQEEKAKSKVLQEQLKAALGGDASDEEREQELKEAQDAAYYYLLYKDNLNELNRMKTDGELPAAIATALKNASDAPSIAKALNVNYKLKLANMSNQDDLSAFIDAINALYLSIVERSINNESTRQGLWTLFKLDDTNQEAWEKIFADRKPKEYEGLQGILETMAVAVGDWYGKTTGKLISKIERMKLMENIEEKLRQKQEQRQKTDEKRAKEAAEDAAERTFNAQVYRLWKPVWDAVVNAYPKLSPEQKDAALKALPDIKKFHPESQTDSSSKVLKWLSSGRPDDETSNWYSQQSGFQPDKYTKQVLRSLLHLFRKLNPTDDMDEEEKQALERKNKNVEAKDLLKRLNTALEDKDRDISLYKIPDKINEIFNLAPSAPPPPPPPPPSAPPPPATPGAALAPPAPAAAPDASTPASAGPQVRRGPAGGAAGGGAAGGGGARAVPGGGAQDNSELLEAIRAAGLRRMNKSTRDDAQANNEENPSTGPVPSQQAPNLPFLNLSL